MHKACQPFLVFFIVTVHCSLFELVVRSISLEWTYVIQSASHYAFLTACLTWQLEAVDDLYHMHFHMCCCYIMSNKQQLAGLVLKTGRLSCINIKYSRLIKLWYLHAVDMGDHIVVINTKRVVLTGKKWDDKLYRYHTG